MKTLAWWPTITRSVLGENVTGHASGVCCASKFMCICPTLLFFEPIPLGDQKDLLHS